MNNYLTRYNTDQRSESARDEDRKSYQKLRLLTRVGIVFLLLTAVITLPSLPALADHKPRTPKKVRAIKNINDDATKDLRNIGTKVEPKAAKAKSVTRRSRLTLPNKSVDSKDRMRNGEIQRLHQ
jgi:hypothetical protein